MTEDLRKKFIERHAGGRPTVYSEEFHIGLLFDVFSKGGSIKKYCLEASIVRSTFKNWVKRNRNFRKAYEDAKDLAEVYFEEMIHSPPENFNYSVWLHSMKTRFKHTQERTLDLRFPKNKRGDKDFESILCMDLLRKCYRGEITTKEYNELSSSLLKKIEIDKLTKIREEMNELRAMLTRNKGNAGRT
jgi:transposase-like protein